MTAPRRGVTSAAPGSVQGLHLVVVDLEQARADLIGRGVDVGEPFHDAGGVFHHAEGDALVAGADPEGSNSWTAERRTTSTIPVLYPDQLPSRPLPIPWRRLLLVLRRGLPAAPRREHRFPDPERGSAWDQTRSRPWCR